MKLTFTQLKQIKSNGVDIRDAIEDLNNIPEWANLDSISEIQSIIQCGCASNAHISCFYADALRIFTDNSNDIEDVLSEYLCEPICWDIQNDTFAQFVSTQLQTAVELICSNFSEMLDGVNWD